MTFGEELLHELRNRIPVDSYFRVEQQERLRQIESKEDLEKFLAEAGIQGASTAGDVSEVAANISFFLQMNRSVGKLGCEGCLLAPFILQANWLIDAFRMGRLRFSLAELLAFTGLFAVCLSYEVSIAPAFLGMPQQLLLALPVALLVGAFPSYLFRNPKWMLVSIDVVVLMEAVAFVVWCRT